MDLTHFTIEDFALLAVLLLASFSLAMTFATHVSVQRVCAPVEHGCLCLLGLLARTLVRNINDIARSRWRASSPCSPWCPAGPARWLILTKTGPVTGADRRKSPRRKR